jgi:hypothetical protein
MILITNNAFCMAQRATAQLNTGIVRGFGVAEAPPVFQRLPQEKTWLI